MQRESPSTGDTQTPSVDQPAGGTHHCAQPNACVNDAWEHSHKHMHTHMYMHTYTRMHMQTEQTRVKHPSSTLPLSPPNSSTAVVDSSMCPCQWTTFTSLFLIFSPSYLPRGIFNQLGWKSEDKCSSHLSSSGTILRQLLHSSKDGWSPQGPLRTSLSPLPPSLLQCPHLTFPVSAITSQKWTTLGSNSLSQDLLRTYMLTYTLCNVLHGRRVGLGLAVGWNLLKYKPLLS